MGGIDLNIYIFNWRVWADFRFREIGGGRKGGFDCNFFFIKFQSDVTGMFSF